MRQNGARNHCAVIRILAVALQRNPGAASFGRRSRQYLRNNNQLASDRSDSARFPNGASA
jgi:hypothetical protein